MKAVNDYRILMPNIPYYETGCQFYTYDVVFFTGINQGIYSQNGITESIGIDFPTGYYYCKSNLNSGENYFYSRPGGQSGNAFWTQDFFFIPTYGSMINFKASYYETNFQDYYTIILGKSENIIQATAQLKFNGITDSEAKAINHFYQNIFVKESLENGQGLEPVNIKLFYPHEKVRPFYIRSIDNNFENVDFNNVTINLESPLISSTEWKEKLIPYEAGLNDFKMDKAYSENDYVFISDSSNQNGFYYYSGTGASIGISPIQNDQTVWTKKFFFKPDLVQDLSMESKIYKNDLGNFYLYQNEGINPNYFDFSIRFSNRRDKEARAILHFLENKNGIEIFDYDGYSFFTGSRSFYCPEWSHTCDFVDNNTITARFIESKLKFDRSFLFNSLVLNQSINFGFLPYGFTNQRDFQIFNSGRRYPVTYSYVGENNPLNDFFQYSDNQPLTKEVNAGNTGLFTVQFRIPRNSTNTETKFSGFYNFSQEVENLGYIGEDLKLNYTGETSAVGSSVSSNFISGVENCVAAPIYSSGDLGFEVRWTLPKSGYYFTSFSGEISTSSGFSPASLVTGVLTSVNLDNSSNLYDIGIPGETTYKINFTGPFNLDTDYYIRISGRNTDYSNHNSKAVFASGVSDVDSWPSITSEYPAVQSGLTADLINANGLTVPAIRFTRQIESRNISNQEFQYFDVYDYIKNNCSFGDSFDLYFGITLNFERTSIGPSSASSDLDIYNTGSLIITGDYSVMPSGLVLNFYNSSSVCGKGGSVGFTNNEQSKVGKNAIYINCSGNISINLDLSSKIGGGGGAGENIDFLDVVTKDSANKFASLKPSSYNNDYSISGINDKINNVKYSKLDLDRFVSLFNSSSIKINSSSASSRGSSILYNFFETNDEDSAKTVFGGAAANYGTGMFFLNKDYVFDAATSPSSPYLLYALISLQQNFNKQQ